MLSLVIRRCTGALQMRKQGVEMKLSCEIMPCESVYTHLTIKKKSMLESRLV